MPLNNFYRNEQIPTPEAFSRFALLNPQFPSVKHACWLVSDFLILAFCHCAYSKSPKPQKPREKQKRVWNKGGGSAKDLDYSVNGHGSPNGEQNQEAPVDLVCTYQASLLIELMMLNKRLSYKFLCPWCALGEAAKLNEGQPAVCGL